MLSSEDFEKFQQEKESSTGSVYTVGSMLDVADTVQYQERQSTADRMLTSFTNGIKGVVREGLHGLQGLRDLNELQLNQAHPGRRQSEQWARDLLDEAADADILKAGEVQSDSALGQLGYDLLQGGGQLATQAALYAIPGGQVISPASMALQISGAEYHELREQGVDIETAEKAGLINAAIQTPLEYIGLSRLMRAFPAGSMLRQRIRHAVENSLTEGLTEFAQEYPEQISKIWALNQDKSMEEIVQMVKDDLGNITSQAGYSGTIGAILGLGASGANLALNRDLTQAMKKEVHHIRMETEEQRIDDLKKEGVNPDYAAVVINDHTPGEAVYIDGSTLNGYAQEKGVEKVAEALGVSVETIEEAAANGDTVDISLGNFEGTAAKFDGFFQAVKNDTAFEEGGYTVNREQQEQELSRKAKEMEDSLRVQQDRIITELKSAGVNNDVALQAAALVTAQSMTRSNPIEAMKQYRVQLGQQAAEGLSQSMYDVRKAGATDILGLKKRIEQRRSEGKEVNKLQFSSDNGIRYAESEIVHATEEHGITDEEWADLEKHGAEIKEPRVSKWKEYTGQYLGKVVVGRIDGDLGSYYVAYEFSPNGDVWFKTAARGSIEGIQNKIEELGAVMLSPEENSPDAVSHSHGSSIDSIKESLGIGKGFHQFAGESAGNADKMKLDEAKRMETDGVAADEIYKKTGWFKGLDGKWRFEIKDQLEDIDFSSLEKFGEMLLVRVYYNEDLFDAYPFLRRVRVNIADLPSERYGQADPGEMRITLNREHMNEEEMRYTFLHEVQHLIQDVEGFASGGSPEAMEKARADHEGEDAFSLYERLGGEQEARYTADRAGEREALRDKVREALATLYEGRKKATPEQLEALRQRELLALEIREREGEPLTDEQRARMEGYDAAMGEELEELFFEYLWAEGDLRDYDKALPQPHQADAIIVFDGQELPYSSQENAAYYQQSVDLKGEYNPEKNIISLFKGADASTVIHETWHFFIEQMWNDVQSGAATEQTEKDFLKLLDYAGMSLEEWKKADMEGRRAAHEKLAEAGETYLMEGRAPSYELRRVFRKFAAWLRGVYRSIQRSENAAELTDDVREVFDRMLAAEDDIARMERINGYFAKLPSVVTEGMSDSTREKVENYIDKARTKAVETLTRRAMKDFTKKRREEAKAMRAEILPSVTEEVSASPVYQSGYTKKDASRYQKLMDKGDAISEKDSAWILEAQLKAENLGYSGAAEMFQDVKNSPTKAQAITAKVNERIRELSPEEEREQYEDAVREALYNEEESLLIGVEQQLIEDFAKKAKGQQIERQQVSSVTADIAAARRQQAKNAAHADLIKMSVKDAMRTDKFITAERKAAVRSAQLLIKKDYDAALAQKNLQAYWHAMAAESLQIKKRKAQYGRFLKTQVKLKPEAWLNEEHFATISNLFVQMGIGRNVHKEAAENSTVSLNAYAKQMEELFDCVDIPEWLRLGNADISNIKALTLEQYADVVNTVKNIKAIVKAQKGVDMFSKNQTFEDMKADLMERFSKLKTVFTPNPNKRTKAGIVEQTTSGMENLDTFLEMLDGADYGYFSKTWGLAIKHAGDHEFECTEAYHKAETEALNKWLPDKKAKKEAAKEVYYEELGGAASKFTLVQMLMNLGNESNAQRLCETAPVGFENSSLWIKPDENLSSKSKEKAALRKEAADLTRKNLVDFLGKVLTKEDVEYAQRKIDAAGMFWGEKNELERRTKGFSMGRIEATPVELTIDGKSVVMRGGYFPLIRNGETGSHAAAAEVAEDEPLQGSRVRTYHTNSGASKARTQAKYPVSLVAGSETGWIMESIHDLCWRETVNSFRRLLNDQDIFGMMKSKVGVARMNDFKSMLEVCADPLNSKSFSNGKTALDTAFAWIRGRTSHAVIMCKLKVITQNYASMLLYGGSIKGYTFGDNVRALGRYMLGYHLPWKHAEMVDYVFSKSAFMRERCEIPDITVRDIMDEKNEYFWEEYTRRLGVQLMALTDNASAVPNWTEAYKKKIDEGATEQEAIDYADILVRRVLGSSRPSDVSRIQRGNEAQRLLTMFQSFFNARYNEFVRMERYAKKQWTEGQKKEAFLTAFGYTVNKWLVQTILAMALAAQNPLGTDEEDGWPELIKELKSYSFSMLGPIGTIGNYVVGKAAGMREFNYRLSAIESTVDKIGRAVSFGPKTTNLEKAERISDSLGTIGGVPYQLNIWLWNMVDILFNGMTPRVGDLFRRRPKKQRDE